MGNGKLEYERQNPRLHGNVKKLNNSNTDNF
jgi:hypothetical protein